MLSWLYYQFVEDSLKDYVELQQDEVSEDLMTFHEKVNHMQELEEEIIDDQKSLIEVSADLLMPIC